MLFGPFTVRGLTLRNRVGVSPMCMYSAVDGVPNDWHLVHLGSRATGGAGMILTEATAVEPRGRISPGDAGLWNDAHVDAWRRIVGFVKQHGSAIGVQLAHAGRKASCAVPWLGGGPLKDERAWTTIGASPLPFDANWHVPEEMSLADCGRLVEQFAESAGRAVRAGFDFVEIHAAHGYLLHSFYSPLSNRRTDSYGGSFENRTRLLRDVAARVRATIPSAMPLFVRLSCTDWTEGGWTIEDSVALAQQLAKLGVDVIDCSSGGNVPRAKIPTGPGYQVPFAARIRREASIATAAVGLISEPTQAESIVSDQSADLVLLARASLRDPNWPIRAARSLGEPDAVPVPNQYLRSW